MKQYSISFAVVHLDPPAAYFAETNEILNEVLAREVVARASAGRFDPDQLAEIRGALLAGEWARSVELWIEATGMAIDIFDSVEAWSEDDLLSRPGSFSVQSFPIFDDQNA